MLDLIFESAFFGFGQNCSEFLADLYIRSNFRFPFAHRSGERRFDRIDRLVGFHFAKRIVMLNFFTRLLEQTNDFGRTNSFAHDWDNDFLCAHAFPGRAEARPVRSAFVVASPAFGIRRRYTSRPLLVATERLIAATIRSTSGSAAYS